MKKLTSSISWNIFLKGVFSEGVGGLIFLKLKNSRLRDFFPEDVLSKLENFYLTNLGRNIFIYQELDNIFETFKREGLSCFLNRGAYFSKYLYLDLGLRPMVDVDLIIFREDLDKFKRVLLDLEYRCFEKYPFFFYKDSFYIDLHLDKPGFWRIGSWPSAFTIKDKRVYERSYTLGDNLPNIRVFDIYDSILSSCQHLQEHSFSRLIWFIDIVKLIKSIDTRFNWMILEERAEEFNLKKSLYFVVKYLKEKRLLFLTQEEDFLRCSLNLLERKSLSLLISDKRDRLCGELLFLFSLKGLKRRFNFLKEVFLLKEEVFPLTCKPNFFSYIFRSFKIIGYVFKRLFRLIWLK